MVKYKTTCPNCQMAHSVEITARQRHEEDFDVSLEYAQKLGLRTNLGNVDNIVQIAIAMYEQKCTDHRGRMANENNLKLEQERHDNRIRMEKFKIKAKQWPYNK